MSKTRIVVEGCEFESIAAACRAYGLKRSTYQQRKARGFLVGDDIFTTPPQKPYTLRSAVCFRSKVYPSFRKMCDDFGINSQTVDTRMRRGGLSLEEALTKPLTPIEDSTGTRLPVGTKRINQQGYVAIKVTKEEAQKYPNLRGLTGQNRGKYWVLEHRLAMCRRLGRDLRPNEIVHHRNGDRADNRIENLELCCDSQPPGQRKKEKEAHYVEWLRKHAPGRLNPFEVIRFDEEHMKWLEKNFKFNRDWVTGSNN